MRATQVIARGKVEFVETPVPQLPPGHVLVRPLLVALCGSDVHRIYFAEEHRYPFPVGTSGHEMVGVVEAADAPGYSFQPGDMVMALSPVETTMAEYFLAQAEDVILLPKGRPLEHLLMGQQLGTVIFASKHLPGMLDKDVAIIGQGSAGLFFDTVCRRLGARQVIALDVKEARVAAAVKFGATHAINNARDDALAAVKEITGGKLADLVIEASGEVETIRLAPQLARVGGHLHYFGIPRAQTFEFDFDQFFRKFLTTTCLAGTAREPGRRSVRQAIDWIAGGEVDASALVTHRLPFERAIEAYELALTRDDGAIKVVVVMPAYKNQA